MSHAFLLSKPAIGTAAKLNQTKMKKFTQATVLLFATALLFSCTKKSPAPLPTAGFNYPKTNETSGTVNFANTSINASSYSWNFGDGTTSILASPIHTYATVGTYTVTLTASNSTGTDVTTGVLNIGAASMTINKIEIDNINNAALYHDHIYLVFNYNNSAQYIGAPFYVSTSSPNQNVVWTIIPTNPLANITATNSLIIYNQVGGVQNPSTDPVIFETGINFTIPDTYGFLNNGNYLPTNSGNSSTGYYNQVFTVTWQ
jgi:PKD repeat protein